MEKNTLIVRYGEVALKGMNKPYFEKVLAGRIKDHINKFYQMGEIEIQRNLCRTNFSCFIKLPKTLY